MGVSQNKRYVYIFIFAGELGSSVYHQIRYMTVLITVL